MGLLQALTELHHAIKPIIQSIQDITRRLDAFAKENPDFFENLRTYFKNFPEIHSKIWKSAAERGWFANWFTTLGFDTAAAGDPEAFDTYMIQHISNNLDNLENNLKSLYPKRKEIISTAFDLHKSKNFIASIPLFLSQADGICAENIGAFIFSEHAKREENIAQIIEDSPESIDRIFWTPMLSETQFGASIGKSKKTDKVKGPNRNGILHGSRKHLDYGTEINSLKAISFVSYIAFIFDKKGKAED